MMCRSRLGSMLINWNWTLLHPEFALIWIIGYRFQFLLRFFIALLDRQRKASSDALLVVLIRYPVSIKVLNCLLSSNHIWPSPPNSFNLLLNNQVLLHDLHLQPLNHLLILPNLLPQLIFNLRSLLNNNRLIKLNLGRPLLFLPQLPLQSLDLMLQIDPPHVCLHELLHLVLHHLLKVVQVRLVELLYLRL